jgi:hypothetical protein
MRRGFLLCLGLAAVAALPTCGGDNAIPTFVTSVRDAVALAASGGATCVIHADKTVDCWGKVDDTASVPSGPSPRRVARTGARQISMYDKKPCLLDDVGTVWCWGLGHEAAPEQVNGLSEVVSISDPAIAIQKNGDVFHFCAPGGCTTPPVSVPWARGASMAAGECAALASTTFPSGGHLQCAPPAGEAPVSWFADRTVRALRGNYNVLALLDDGSLFCTGNSRAFECGDALDGSSGPRQVPRIPPAVELVGDGCARARDGAVWCWGLAPSLPIDRASLTTCDAKLPLVCTPPIEVPALRNAAAVALAGNHGCAIMGDGSLKCWGDNTYGQLGQ